MSEHAAPSVARRVAYQAAAIMAVTLALVGIGTGVIAHLQQHRALDRLLLAAALGGAHPPVPGGWEVEHQAAVVDTWIVHSGDPLVPSELALSALRREVPVYVDLGDVRVVLLTVEREQEGHDHDDDDDETYASQPGKLLVAAAAPAVTLSGSVGAFAAIYAVVGLLAALVAAWALRASVQAAFLPLQRATDDAARVTALGQGRRLTQTGPLEIRSLLASVNALLDRLDGAYAAQGRFTAEAAHELRTPVATMLGELEVALRQPRSAGEYRRVLKSSHEEVLRLARLVTGLTALARLDAGQAETIREPIHAAELARAAVAGERAALDRAGCVVRIHAAVDPEIVVHRALMEIALGNLLRNAGAHASGLAVDLRIGVVGGLVAFDVDDAGPGVAADQREALFDRFVRGGEARRRSRGGLGLGLPIVRQVARRHGGDCTLLASPAGGLRARLTVLVHSEAGQG